jgi:hypothetical protein
MKYLCRVLVVALVVTAACASLPAKQRAVVGLQASETALEAAHDAERALCAPSANQSQPIVQCDGAQAAAIGLTDARHQQLARVFATAFASEAHAATALKAWQAGDPAPVTVADYHKDVTAVLALVANLIPSAQSVVTKVQTAVDEAAAIAKLVGVH